MFAFDRDTATLVATVVCIAATIYLYRELKKTRDELTTAITAKQQPVVFMEPSPAVAAAPVPEPEPAPAPAPAPAPPVAKPMSTRKKHVTVAEPETEK